MALGAIWTCSTLFNYPNEHKKSSPSSLVWFSGWLWRSCCNLGAHWPHTRPCRWRRFDFDADFLCAKIFLSVDKINVNSSTVVSCSVIRYHRFFFDKHQNLVSVMMWWLFFRVTWSPNILGNIIWGTCSPMFLFPRWFWGTWERNSCSPNIIREHGNEIPAPQTYSGNMGTKFLFPKHVSGTRERNSVPQTYFGNMGNEILFFKWFSGTIWGTCSPNDGVFPK